MKLIFSLFIFIFIISCNNSNKFEKVGDSDLYKTTVEDKKMEEAIKKAKSSFSDFKTHFFSKDSNLNYFSIKVPFSYDGLGSNEHIWLSDISFSNGDFYGIVDNAPEYVKNIQVGESA